MSWPFFGAESGYITADSWIVGCYQSTKASTVGDPVPAPPDTEGAFICGTHNVGYGDSFGDAVGEILPGGYGDHGAGYGHPCDVGSVGVLGGRIRHDLGGERVDMVTDSGTVPSGPLTVTVGGVECYSGVSGQGNVVNPSDDLSAFGFVMPAQWGVTGDVDVVVTGPSSSTTFLSAISVVQHPGRSGVLFVSSRCDTDVNLLTTYRPRL